MRFDIDDSLLFIFNKYALYRIDKYFLSRAEQSIVPPASPPVSVQYNAAYCYRDVHLNTRNDSRLIELERREKSSSFCLYRSIPRPCTVAKIRFVCKK